MGNRLLNILLSEKTNPLWKTLANQIQTWSGEEKQSLNPTWSQKSVFYQTGHTFIRRGIGKESGELQEEGSLFSNFVGVVFLLYNSAYLSLKAQLGLIIYVFVTRQAIWTYCFSYFQLLKVKATFPIFWISTFSSELSLQLYLKDSPNTGN